MGVVVFLPRRGAFEIFDAPVSARRANSEDRNLGWSSQLPNLKIGCFIFSFGGEGKRRNGRRKKNRHDKSRGLKRRRVEEIIGRAREERDME